MIEVLAAIVVIGLLSGLISVAVRRAADKGAQVKCAANMRSIGLGLNLYADEHNNMYPFGGNDATGAGEPAWYMNVAPYVDIPDGVLGSPPKLRATGVLICPSFEPSVNRATSYGINIFMMKNHSFSHRWSYRRMVCPNPAKTILVGEKNNNSDQVYPEDYGTVSSYVERRHLGGANYVMLDGHIEYIEGVLPGSDPKWNWWD